MTGEERTTGANGKGKLELVFPERSSFDSMLDVALFYVDHKLPIFPVSPQNKIPYPGSHGFYDATLDKDQIRQWWRRYPDAMIATATGLHSGFLVVDLDRKEAGKDGVATWAKLTAEHGGTPVTLSSTTLTGEHHIFKHRYGLRCVALDKIAPGVEIKADGGYIVLPPSLYTGPSSAGVRRYLWKRPLVPLAEPPDWLVALIEEQNDRHPDPSDIPAPRDPSVPIERIVAALTVIDPDIDRKSWIAIGCALYTQLEDKEGFELWSKWSSGKLRGSESQKYKEGEMDYQWSSLVAGNYPYAIGTVFWHANEAQPDWDTTRVEEPTWPGTPADGGHHEAAWPEMDEAAYHGFAGEVVRTISPHSESDPVALLLQTLICFGNIIGRTRYILLDGSRHHANLFASLVGRTSKARKGTSFERTRQVVRYVDPNWDQERVQGGLSSGEGLIFVVRDPTMKWDKDDQQWVEADHGIDDKRLLVVEPEFAAVLAVMQRPGGNTVSHLIRKAWDGVRLQTMTRKEPLTATGAHISLIGHITEDELRASLTRTDMANGFANRFLFALVKRSKLLPFGGDLSESDLQQLGEKLRKIVDTVTGDPLNRQVPTPLVTMTEAARTEWSPIYHNMADERLGLLGAIAARGEPQILRLAMIYALLDKADQIDLPHLQAGLAVWNYCEASAAHIFGATLGDEVADTILRALKNAGRNGISRATIRDLFGGHKSKERTDAALALLAEKGRARVEIQGGTRGRPLEMWFAAK